MRICRFRVPGLGVRLGVIDEGRILDLTSADPSRFQSLDAVLALPDPLRVLTEAAKEAKPSLPWSSIDRPPGPNTAHRLPPLESAEVWGAGVTYERSKEARRAESESGGDFYQKAHEAERPEIFFKANPHRVVGPQAPIRIREDSTWTVPEPELALVLGPSLQIVGYTVGNDVSSRSIEGENPLYLPQAKIYDGCCALGPAILMAEPSVDPMKLDIRLIIRRGGREVFEGFVSTSQMRRRPEELVEYLGRNSTFPKGAVLLTGTGIVPPDDFSLQPGDFVEVSIPGIGTLRNPVARGRCASDQAPE